MDIVGSSGDDAAFFVNSFHAYVLEVDAIGVPV